MERLKTHYLDIPQELSALDSDTSSNSAAAADISQQINVGPDPWNRTYYPKGAHADNSKKPWYIIDAKDQTLGRLASLAANKIRLTSFFRASMSD